MEVLNKGKTSVNFFFNQEIKWETMVTISNPCSLEATAGFWSHCITRVLEHLFLLDTSQEKHSEAARLAINAHDLSMFLPEKLQVVGYLQLQDLEVFYSSK